ncbi:MAG: hypothetical protein IJV20_07960 [Prevotella sp.]|nr:hypothetical protein [Prevotella sp.]
MNGLVPEISGAVTLSDCCSLPPPCSEPEFWLPLFSEPEFCEPELELEPEFELLEPPPLDPPPPSAAALAAAIPAGPIHVSLLTFKPK